ncbi:MAG: AAA family ATPase [Acidobacteria bacterium]|nr:AAA family ATPase [Acidobacteriota bacterium]
MLPTKTDGSKSPSVGTWTEYKTTRPTPDQNRRWGWEYRDGYGVVAGAVSGGRECWDFDDRDVFDAFVAAADGCGLGDGVRRIRAGYEDRTPRGGVRWIVQYAEAVEWRDCTLARRPPRDGETHPHVLIELPTFNVLAPSNGSTHPTGLAYTRQSGGFDTIACYTVEERDALLTLARSFDEMPRREAAPSRPVSAGSTGDRPGDDFNRRASWPDLLPDWAHVFERGGTIYLRRPGKDHDVSATINHGGGDCLYVFSSSTEFDPEKSYTKFGVYATLHHGGDYRKAALALSQLGYGDGSPVVRSGTTDAKPDTAPASDPTAAVSGFARPAIVEGIGECVLAPKLAQPYSGWFMRGAVHLVAGASASGKSTLMIDVLERQARGERVLGHVGQRLDYLILAADRGGPANAETLSRMKIAPGTLPITHIPAVAQAAPSVAAILAAVEAEADLPAVVFVEGADMLVEDPSKPAVVARFMTALQTIAEHYAVALVLSVGAPKARPKEQYTVKRDQVFGSQLWSRMACDVLVLSVVGDGTQADRDLVVLHRNAPAESFHLTFEAGRLVEADPAPATDADYVTWFREVEVFLAIHFRRRFNLSGARATQLLDGYVAIGTLRTKVRNDRTSYIYKRSMASSTVSTSTGSVDTAPATDPTSDSVHETCGRGHDPQGESCDFPNDSEAQQEDPLIPTNSLSIVHGSLSSLSPVDNGQLSTVSPRAREDGGDEALPAWVTEDTAPDDSDPIGAHDEE